MGNLIERAKKITNGKPIISEFDNHDIAIIGMDGCFPGAANLEEFWNNLKNGVDSISQIPVARQRELSEFIALNNDQDILAADCREMGYIDGIDEFDYSFFGITKKEGQLMDPNQRVLLQSVSRCIEDAGYGKQIYGSRTGVFVGFSDDAYYKNAISQLELADVQLFATDYLHSAIAARIAYQLDLHGPSLVLDTACSSSLAAVHYACQSLRNQESDLAIVGSIKINLFPMKPKYYNKTESQDGHTRTYDENAEGLGIGEGVASVLLKPLSDAIRDKDSVYAVIHGTAMNTDGRTNGFTSPNSKAQARVIMDAWKDARINPMDVSYIETHGTATKLGDSIEISGINEAFSHFTKRKNFCAVGSVKTNIGHLDHASGMAGLIKTVLMLKHRKLLPSLHFCRPNRNIDFIQSAVYVSNQLEEWNPNDKELKCGVSSIGLTGVNCHIVLGEYKAKACGDKETDSYVFTVSAKSKLSLRLLLNDYVTYLEKNKEKIRIEDLCYTSNVGRCHYRYRLAIIVENVDELIEKLHDYRKAEQTDENKHIYFADAQVSETSLQSGNAGQSKRVQMLYQLIQSYLNQESVSFEKQYKTKPYRIHIPTYRFEPQHCWFHPYDELNIREDELLHGIEWMPEEDDTIDNASEYGACLIVGWGKKNEQIHNLSKDNPMVITASFDSEIPCDFVVEGSVESYQNVFLKVQNKSIETIIYITGTNHNVGSEDFTEFDETSNREIERFLNFYKALKQNAGMHIKQLICLARNVEKVTKEEQVVSPVDSIIFGFARAIGVEELDFHCKCIDYDEQFEKALLENEIKSQSQDRAVAYRDKKRYVPYIVDYDQEPCTQNQLPIKEKGVYVITGGTGKIGIYMADKISQKKQVHIVLLGTREKCADRESDKLYDELALRIRSIEDRGSKVSYYKTDIANPEELKGVLAKVRKEAGRINGVIHCAASKVGIVGGLLVEETLENVRKDLSVKVQGSWCIDHYTREDNLDFFIAMTSPISWIGGIGIASYIASNSFLSTYVRERNLQGYQTKAVGWAAWQHVLERQSHVYHENRQLFHVLSTEDIDTGWDKALRLDVPEVAVGRINYRSEFMLLEGKLFHHKKKDRAGNSNGNGRVRKEKARIEQFTLTGREDGNYTKMEEKVAKAWCNTLGVTTVDIHDDFFECGGHSLLSIKLEMELKNQFKYSDIYKYPTVKSIAEFLSSEEK